MPTYPRVRAWIATAAAAAATLTAAPAAAATFTAAGGVRCHDTSYPVHVLGQAAHISGTLCRPAGASTLALLIPGGTYVRGYYSAPFRGRNYVAAAGRAGYATLAIDRLDTGASTQTPPLLTTQGVQASAIHQVITAIRGHWRHVVLVGHSLGSVDAVAESGRWPGDVDGVILSGFTHQFSPTGIAKVAATLVPAHLQARFASRPLGELTSASEAARNAAFHASDVPAAVTRWDWTHRDIMDVTELAAGALSVYTGRSTSITAPVLNVQGSGDYIFACSALGRPCSSAAAMRTAEAHRYPRTASYTADVVRDSAHDLNLDNGAPTWFQIANRWIATHVDN